MKTRQFLAPGVAWKMHLHIRTDSWGVAVSHPEEFTPVGESSTCDDLDVAIGTTIVGLYHKIPSIASDDILELQAELSFPSGLPVTERAVARVVEAVFDQLATALGSQSTGGIPA